MNQTPENSKRSLAGPFALVCTILFIPAGIIISHVILFLMKEGTVSSSSKRMVVGALWFGYGFLILFVVSFSLAIMFGRL